MPKPAPGRDSYTATAHEIRPGRTTDLYSVRTRDIPTKAARIRKLVNGKQVLSFGVRRMHPGIAPLIERSVTIGGLDAITTPLGADLLGVPAIGTMPHALVIVMGGPREAFAAVHKYLEAKIPRIALVDTYYDEKTEALMAVEAIPDLSGIRLDT